MPSDEATPVREFTVFPEEFEEDKNIASFMSDIRGLITSAGLALATRVAEDSQSIIVTFEEEQDPNEISQLFFDSTLAASIKDIVAGLPDEVVLAG